MIRIRNIAHRGLYNDVIAENTLSAFNNAVNNGYSIELDIQLTKDDKIIVFHDTDLKRIFGTDKKVCDCDHSELSGYKIGKLEEKIPSLSEVFSLVDGKVPILIELKENGRNIPIGPKVMELLLNYKGEYMVQSFYYKQIVWFKNNMPSVPRGMIYSKKGFAYAGLLNRISKPVFLALDINIPAEKVIKQRKKRPVFVWTVGRIEDYLAARNAYDGIIFEKFEPEEWQTWMQWK